MGWAPDALGEGDVLPMERYEWETVRDIYRDTADGGTVRFSRRYRLDPLEAVRALHPDSEGFVVEADGAPVGAAFSSYGRRRYNDRERETALIHGQAVHPDYQEQGLGARLHATQLERARERDEDVVAFANIQQDNEPALSLHRSACDAWSHEWRTVATRTASSPPHDDELTVRAVAHPGEFEAIAPRLNDFYADACFYREESVESLYYWTERTPFDAQPVHHYLVCTDASGEILAGAGLTDEFRLRLDYIRQAPLVLRVLDGVLGISSGDGRLRQAVVSRFWHRPDRADAGRYLWESARAMWGDDADVLIAYYDPSGPLGDDVLGVRPWTPTTSARTAVYGADEPAGPLYPVM